ncbi:MAG TPA: hypothetical protein VFZ16_21400 [Hyphomicrobiaceae bacterium]|nr:hypothetical protein [Hyphomicrobiaceae bacterium]
MAIKETLAWLIERHWRDLQIGQHAAHAAADLSEREVEVGGKRARLSARTISNMLNGHVTKPTRHTCRVLAELFRPHIPDITPRWFHASTEEFKQLVEGTAAPQRYYEALDERRPGGEESIGTELDGGDDALEGTYMAYRHAFSANTVNRIAREVLHIQAGRNGMEFRMSYLPGARGRSDMLWEFRGLVEALGPSIMLLGRSVGPDVERRTRTLYIRNSSHIDQPELENYKLGLMSSAREGDGIPCAACVLLVKVQRQIESEHVTAFMNAATRTDAFDSIIGSDFVDKDWLLVRLFLDNRPSRSPKNPEDENDMAMGALEGPGQRDPVLRIAQDRFERSMEEVFQHSLDAEHLVPTFRADWRGHEEAGTDA